MSGRLTGLQFQRTIASQSNEVEMIHADGQSFFSNVLTGKEDQPMSETCSDEPTEKPSTSKFTKRNNNITAPHVKCQTTEVNVCGGSGTASSIQVQRLKS
jgi:hypothetical protein